MLQLRPGCECCDVDLPPNAGNAYICSFECTFCHDCVNTRLHGKCPNCGGDLTPRPTREASLLERHPASSMRVMKTEVCR